MDNSNQSEPARITLEELFKKIFSSIAQLIDSFPIIEEEPPAPKRDTSNSGP
jgi:hypothetical protein